MKEIMQGLMSILLICSITMFSVGHKSVINHQIEQNIKCMIILIKGNCTALKNCKSCLDYNETDCFWCEPTCMKKDGILPKGCESMNWRYYDYCSVPGYVWVIVIPVLCGVILIALGCFFYCCCCRCKTSKRGAQNEETKFHRKRMELKAKHAERRAERKLKTDEIRRKYGLDKDDGSSTSRYHQFDNDPEA